MPRFRPVARQAHRDPQDAAGRLELARRAAVRAGEPDCLRGGIFGRFARELNGTTAVGAVQWECDVLHTHLLSRPARDADRVNRPRGHGGERATLP